MAIAAGITPAEICAYVQNDGYGLDALNSPVNYRSIRGANREKGYSTRDRCFAMRSAWRSLRGKYSRTSAVNPG